MSSNINGENSLLIQSHKIKNKLINQGNLPSISKGNIDAGRMSNIFKRLPPVDDIQGYVAAVNSVPILTKDEEELLCDEFYKKNNMDAGNILFLSHLRLVVKMAFGFKKYYDNIQDLIAEGNLGLLKALKKFSIEKGVRFATYAMLWIRASMQDFVFKNKSIVRSITTNNDKSIVYNSPKLSKELDMLGDSDANEMYNTYFDTSKEHAKSVMQRAHQSDISTDAFIDGEMQVTIGETLPSNTPNPKELYNQNARAEDAKQTLGKALDTLDERSRRVIYARYIIDKKKTLAELSRELGISIERVRQIETAVMNKLRNILVPQVNA
jgi:RNA polymerase sigma-32 factor